jgi:hypothetical protein
MVNHLVYLCVWQAPGISDQFLFLLKLFLDTYGFVDTGAISDDK